MLCTLGRQREIRPNSEWRSPSVSRKRRRWRQERRGTGADRWDPGVCTSGRQCQDSGLLSYKLVRMALFVAMVRTAATWTGELLNALELIADMVGQSHLD